MDLFGDLPDPGQTKCNTDSSLNDNLVSEQRTASTVNTTEKRIIEVIHDTSEPKRLKSSSVILQSYVTELQGERDEMQDAHSIIENFNSLEKHKSIDRMGLYAVYDGHAGTRASKYCSDHLHLNLIKKLPQVDADTLSRSIKKCFVETFKLTDEEFLKAASKEKPVWRDGTTATVLLRVDNTFYIASLGDSRAILCRRNSDLNKLVPVALTKDHNPSVYEERLRIQKCRGTVKDGRVMGILEVSRSIGDGSFKNLGVICTPDVKRVQIIGEDRFLIIACDGLWKAFTDEQAVEFVNNILKDESINGTESKSAEEVRYENACFRLASEAVKKLSGDNVTVIIISVTH